MKIDMIGLRLKSDDDKFLFIYHNPRDQRYVRFKVHEFKSLESRGMPFFINESYEKYLLSKVDVRDEISSNRLMRALEQKYPNALPDGVKWDDIAITHMYLTVENY